MSKVQILDPRQVKVAKGKKNMSHGSCRAARKPNSPRVYTKR